MSLPILITSITLCFANAIEDDEVEIEIEIETETDTR